MRFHVQFPKDLLDRIRDLEKEVGITPGFFHGLIKEDDWSFIIKLHSLFEAAVSHLLIKALQKDELKEIIPSLELSNTQSGKLAFARSLKLLDKEETTYIKKLSELRNKLVHNVANVNFNLEGYVNKLDTQQLKSFIKSFGFSTKKEIELKDQKISRDQFIKGNPKLAIWLGALECFDVIYDVKKNIELKAKLDEELVKFAKLIRSKRSNK